jgi:hypothetical protein
VARPRHLPVRTTLAAALTPGSSPIALPRPRTTPPRAPSPSRSSATPPIRRGAEAHGCLSSTSLTTFRAWVSTPSGSRPLVVRTCLAR